MPAQTGLWLPKNPQKHAVGLYKESAARSTPAYRLLEFCHNITVTRNLLCTTKFDPGHLALLCPLFIPDPLSILRRHHTFASFVLSLCAPLPSSFLLLFTCFLLQQHLTSSRLQIITLPYHLAFYVFSVFNSYWCLFHFTARPFCVLPSSLCCSCLYGYHSSHELIQVKADFFQNSPYFWLQGTKKMLKEPNNKMSLLIHIALK